MENYQKNLEKIINNQVKLTSRNPFVNLNPLSRNPRPGSAPDMCMCQSTNQTIHLYTSQSSISITRLSLIKGNKQTDNRYTIRCLLSSVYKPRVKQWPIYILYRSLGEIWIKKRSCKGKKDVQYQISITMKTNTPRSIFQIGLPLSWTTTVLPRKGHQSFSMHWWIGLMSCITESL